MSTTYFENIKFYEDVNYIGVDGYELSYLTGDSYMFSTSGNHMVDFSFAGGNIPDSMFAYCDDIITAYINEDSCEIGAYAFMQCQNLESVYIPSTMAYINSYAFYDTNISYLEILATTPPTLGDNVFSTEPDYISVPTAYENDYKQASGWSDYEDVINPQPKYDIVGYLFVSSTSSNTPILNEGFQSVIDELYIDDVKQDSIDYQYQFTTTGTHIIKINLKDNTTIPNEMFKNSWRLNGLKYFKLYIGDTIASIGSNAFYKLGSDLSGNTKMIIFNSTTPPVINSDTFAQTSTIYKYVPYESYDLYSQAQYWSNIDSNYLLPMPKIKLKYTISNISEPTQLFHDESALIKFSSMNIDGINRPISYTYQFTSTGSHDVVFKVAYLGDVNVLTQSIFEDNSYITSAYFCEGVGIPTYAFKGCSQLSYISHKYTTIGVSAFENCTSLETVSLNPKTSTFKNYVFKGCSSLSYLEIKQSPTIKTQAFANTGLSKLILPQSVSSITSGAFSGSNNLSYIDVRVLNTKTFCNNTSIYQIVTAKSGIGINLIDENGNDITNFVIPSDVTSLSGRSFENCRNLDSITSYALNPPTFGNDAFKGTQLSAIYVDPDSVDLYKAASGWSNYSSIITTWTQPTAEYSVEYTAYSDEEGTTAKYMNPYAFYIEEDGNSEFSIDLFNELVDSITWNGGEMLIENESDFDYTPSIEGDNYLLREGDVVKIIFNSASIPARAFEDVRMSECTVSEGITTLGATAFQYAGENPLVNHKTSLHLPSTLTSISSTSLDGYFMDIYLDAATPPTTTDDNPINIATGVYPILHVPSASQTLYENDAHWNPLSTGPFAINPNIDLEWSVYNTDDLSAQEYEGSNLMSIYSFTDNDTFSQTLYNQIVKRIWINGEGYSPNYNSNSNTLVYWPNANGIHFMRLELQNNASLPEAMFQDWGINVDYHVNKQITTVPEMLLNGISPGDIYLPSTATTLQTDWTVGCNAAAIHFETATPPAIDANAPSSLQYKELYVPAASESLYKAAANWSTIARNINPKNSVQVEFEIDFKSMDPDNTGYGYGIKLCNDSKTSLDNYIISGISLTKEMPWQRNIETVLSTNNIFIIAFNHNNNGDIYDPYNIYKIGLASDTAIAEDLFKDAFQNYYIDYNTEPYDWNDGGQEGNVYVTVNEGITTIESGAFQDSYVNVIYLPSTITSIGANAFNTTNGNGLSSLYIKAETPPAIGTDILDVTALLGIHVPAASEAAYKAASGWSNYAQYISGDIYDD